MLGGRRKIDTQLAAKCMCLAIVVAAQEEYLRLTQTTVNGHQPTETLRKIQGSLKSLDRMKSLYHMPDYTGWDPLMYGTWYQPRQINLAHGILTWARSKLWEDNPFQPRTDEWQVVDFGAGSLAVHFAVAIAAAEEIDQGTPIRRIQIDSIDTSPEMMDFGSKMWDWYKVLAAIEDPNGPLDQAVRSIEWTRHTSTDSVDGLDDAERYLVGINAVYGQNTSVVKNDLAALVSSIQPDCVLLSAVEWKLGLLRQATPLDGSESYEELIETESGSINLSVLFSSNVDLVSEWRRDRWRELESQWVPSRDGNIDWTWIRWMLSNNVTWNYPDTAILAYTKRTIEDDLPW